MKAVNDLMIQTDDLESIYCYKASSVTHVGRFLRLIVSLRLQIVCRY